MEQEKKIEKQEKKCDCKCEHQQEEKHNKNKKHCCKEHANKEIEKLKKELEEATNKAMVVQAEMINFRRRKEEETASMLKYANQDLILEVISVLDNFERALNLDDNNLNDELSKFLVGFKMIYASLSEILKKYGVEEIKAYEKEFDPSMHQAMMVDKDENKPNNIVLDVLLKGYKLKDRVIRPAAVKVNKLDD